MARPLGRRARAIATATPTRLRDRLGRRDPLALDQGRDQREAAERDRDGRVRRVRDRRERRGRRDRQGSALPHERVDDGDHRRRQAGAGRRGRPARRRGHVPVGYYKDAEKTAATFVEFDGVRWAIPGDRAVIEDDGTITVLGRGSQCINTGGEKVFPEEVEAVLKSHPDVFDAIVVGVPDDALRRSGRGRGRAARGQDADARRSRRALPHARSRLQAAEAPRARRRGRPHTRGQAQLPLGEGARDFRVTLAHYCGSSAGVSTASIQPRRRASHARACRP